MAISKHMTLKCNSIYKYMSCKKQYLYYYIWYITSKINILNLDQTYFMFLFGSVFVLEYVTLSELLFVIINAITLVLGLFSGYMIFKNNEVVFYFIFYSYLYVFNNNKTNISKSKIFLGVIIFVLFIVLILFCYTECLDNWVFTSPDNQDSGGNNNTSVNSGGNSSAGDKPGANHNTGGNNNPGPDPAGNNNPGPVGNGNNKIRYYGRHGSDGDDPDYDASPRVWSALKKAEAIMDKKKIEFSNGLITQEERNWYQDQYKKADQAYTNECNAHYDAKASNFKGPNNVKILN